MKTYNDGTGDCLTEYALPTLKAGALAYFDTFAGLVPCRVTEIFTTAAPGYSVRFKITATRGAYKRGETLDSHSRNVVPRSAVFVRSGQYRIRRYSIAA